MHCLPGRPRNLLGRFFVDPFNILAAEHALAEKFFPEQVDRVALGPGVYFFLWPGLDNAQIRNTLGMGTNTVGLEFDQARPFTVARPLDGALDGLVHGDHVLAVRHLARNTVTLCKISKIFATINLAHGRAPHVKIVLNHVDDGKPPIGGHDDGLVEGAAGVSAFALNAQDDLAFAPHLGGNAEPRGDDKVTAKGTADARKAEL